MSKQFTKAEVAQNKEGDNMFIIIDDGVYNVASMSARHLEAPQSQVGLKSKKEHG